MTTLDKPVNATEDDILNAIRQTAEFPLSVNISPQALRFVERAIRSDLIVMRGSTNMSAAVNTELMNLANTIRAYLQHVAKDAVTTKVLEALEDDPLLK